MTVRRTPAPAERVIARGRGVISGLIMAVCAVFALGIGALPAHADIDPVARGIAAKALIPTQSLGAQLRTAYATASQSNPAINAPWKIVPAWVTATPYVQGNVVSNGGHLYVTSNGTCTSGATAPTSVNGTASNDGACSWFYVGEAQLSASDPLGPTVTFTTGSAPFGGGTTVLWYPAIYPSVYKAYGVTPATFATNYWSLTSFNSKSGNALGYAGKICTEVLDSKFAIAVTNGSGRAGITIDGRLYSPETFLTTTGNLAMIVFDFSSTTGMRTREVCFRPGTNNSNFAGVFTTVNGTLSAPPAQQEIKAAIIWDSYDAGSNSGPYMGPGTFSQQLGDRMGWTTIPMGSGGTGVQANGTGCSGACYNYDQRVNDAGNKATIATAQVVMFNVSTNDAGLSGEQAAITTLLSDIRAANPTALIIGVGPPPINTGATYAQTQALDTAGAAAFAAWSDPAGAGKACYVPVANATIPWITSSSYMTGLPANSNSAAVLISAADSVHPTDLGTRTYTAWTSYQVATKCLAAVK